MNPDTPSGREGIARYKRDLYQRWLDEPCAALDDLTPRQAASQGERRQSLRQELLHMERIEATVVTPGARNEPGLPVAGARVGAPARVKSSSRAAEPAGV